MTPLDEEELSRRLSRACALLVLFLALTVGGFYALSAATDATVSQSFVSYTHLRAHETVTDLV